MSMQLFLRNFTCNCWCIRSANFLHRIIIYRSICIKWTIIVSWIVNLVNLKVYIEYILKQGYTFVWHTCYRPVFFEFPNRPTLQENIRSSCDTRCQLWHINLWWHSVYISSNVKFGHKSSASKPVQIIHSDKHCFKDFYVRWNIKMIAQNTPILKIFTSWHWSESSRSNIPSNRFKKDQMLSKSGSIFQQNTWLSTILIAEFKL